MYKDFYGNDVDDTEDDLVEMLKGVFYERCKGSPAYMAGTLIISIKNTLYEFNINDIVEESNRLNYWTAKNYIKSKTPSHYYWDISHKIAAYCEEKGII